MMATRFTIMEAAQYIRRTDPFHPAIVPDELVSTEIRRPILPLMSAESHS
jgi:hypothetical protein